MLLGNCQLFLAPIHGKPRKEAKMFKWRCHLSVHLLSPLRRLDFLVLNHFWYVAEFPIGGQFEDPCLAQGYEVCGEPVKCDGASKVHCDRKQEEWHDLHCYLHLWCHLVKSRPLGSNFQLNRIPVLQKMKF